MGRLLGLRASALLGATRPCSPVSGGRTGAPGQCPARAREVAGIAVRVALEIVLVLRLGLPEFAGGRDLRHNAAWPQAGRIDIVDCPECLVTLRLGHMEDL